jgi:hypothetical protein
LNATIIVERFIATAPTSRRLSEIVGHRIFRVMRVNDGHGVGVDLASKPDGTIQYDGKAILIQLSK